ncbi:MAG: hypothetical protein FWG39_00705 [Alphaproteobacteria bacterium]|nr:hypothetical protein [Alphaproteobacteria bacterium]
MKTKTDVKNTIRKPQENPNSNRVKKQGEVHATEFVVVCPKGATDHVGRPATHYKGNLLDNIANIGHRFTTSKTAVEEGWTIDDHKVEMKSIKVITASNSAASRDTPTTVHPVQKDTVTGAESFDSVVWCEYTAKVGEMIVNTPWMCFVDFEREYVIHAAKDAPDFVAYLFGHPDHPGCIDGIRRAIESAYRAARGR